jgi:hypothetical protein
VPSATNQQLLKSLLAGGFYRDRIKAGEFTTEQVPALRQLEAELEPACRPASVLEIAAVVERLFAHYFRPDMPDSAAANRLDDWYDDLDGLPVDVLQATARDWRRSDAKYAPTPGQFLAKAKRYADPRVAGLGMARMLIKALAEASTLTEEAA